MKFRWFAYATVAALLIGGPIWIWPVWQNHQLVSHLGASIPARPEARNMPAMLVARLTAAEQQAQNSASAVKGVAELGRLYHASGYKPQAEVCWQLLRSAEPREGRWCYYLADLRRSASDYTGMTEWLQQTTQLAPEYAPAWLRLADLQFKSGQLADAEHNYQKRLSLLPNDPYATLGLVRIALQQGRRDQARTLVEQLVKTAPDFSPGHNLYAEMLTAAGDDDSAKKQRWLGRETGRFRDAADPWLDELVAWCFNYEQLCIRGTMDYQTNQGDRGKSCFERAIELQPNNPIAYDLLGSLYLEIKDPGKARDVLELGLKRAGATAPTALYYVRLSRAHRELKQPAEAARVAREGLARLGEEFELYDALGTALGDLGERDAAVDALHAAVKLNPTDTNANYNLALALIATRKLDEAVAALHRSLQLRPTFPSSLALLAQIEIDSGRWASALQYLQPLYDSHPEMPQARQMMLAWHQQAGIEAENKKDLAAAERHYRAGLAIDGQHADLQERLGTIFLMNGRFADAVEPLEALHRLQPENPRACLFLGQAYAATGRMADAKKVLAEGVQVAERTGNKTTADYCREILQHLP